MSSIQTSPQSKMDSDDDFARFSSPIQGYPLTQLSQSPAPSDKSDPVPHTSTDCKPFRPDMSELRSYLEKLKDAEKKLAERLPAWHCDKDAKTTENAERVHALLKRYRATRAAFIRRRTKELVAEQAKKMQGEPFEYPEGCSKEDGRRVLGKTSDVDKENNGAASSSKNAQLLDQLAELANEAQEKSIRLATSYRALRERRVKIEAMVDDCEQKQREAGAEEDSDTHVQIDESSGDFVTDEMIEIQKQKNEELLSQKGRMQEELAVLTEEKAMAESKVVDLQKKLSALRMRKVDQESDEKFAEVKDLDQDSLDEKISQLEEIEEWYSGLRLVMEEVSGMAIVSVSSDPTTRQMLMTVCLYGEFLVEITLKEEGNMLKVDEARWASPAVVSATGESDKDNKTDESAPLENLKPFELVIGPLDDLVQVAKSMLQPPYDVRFILREALFRIRLMKDRVSEIAALRRHVLTRVDGGDKVICSLDEGIIISLRLHERLIAVEQVVGIGGWDAQVVDEIREALPDYRKRRRATPGDEPVTITSIVQQVRDHVERIKQGGTKPKTPRLPLKKPAFF